MNEISCERVIERGSVVLCNPPESVVRADGSVGVTYAKRIDEDLDFTPVISVMTEHGYVTATRRESDFLKESGRRHHIPATRVVALIEGTEVHEKIVPLLKDRIMFESIGAWFDRKMYKKRIKKAQSSLGDIALSSLGVK